MDALDLKPNEIRQRLRVARLTLELVPGAEKVAQEQLDAAADLLEAWKTGAAEPERDAAPASESRPTADAASRAAQLARAAELTRALRDELSKRRPTSKFDVSALLRRWWWAGLLVVAMVAYVALSVSHRSFKPSDWRKPTVSGLRIDGWNQSYGPVMVGTKRRGVPVSLEGRTLGPSVFVHAASTVNVTVLADGSKLSGTCGYPDEMLGNAVVCTIRDGDRVLFESPVLDETHRSAPFKVSLPPARRVKLELRSTMEHIRMAQGVWTDLQVTR